MELFQQRGVSFIQERSLSLDCFVNDSLGDQNGPADTLKVHVDNFNVNALQQTI